jgi:hypothetical protein
MAEAAFVVLAFVASYAGFALLALRQKPHHAAVSGERSRAALPASLLTRNLVLGCGLLASSLGTSMLAQGPSFGSILWVLLLAAGAQGVLFTLTYRPRWLRPLWRAVHPRRSSLPS